MKIILYNRGDDLGLKVQTQTVVQTLAQTLTQAQTQVQTPVYPRQELANILHDYNLGIGNKTALGQIERLRSNNTFCIVTGQQLGFMGGPIYTILKAITCLQVAKDVGAIPIFWLATEDHDIDEIDHTYLQDSNGNMEKFRLNYRKRGAFVEDLTLSKGHMAVIEQFLEVVGQKTLFLEIKNETSYTRAMIKVLLHLFAGTGLVFVEPYLLRPLAKNFFKKELSQYSNKTNLFFKTETGVRSKIHKGGAEFDNEFDNRFNNKLNNESNNQFNDNFIIGSQKYSLTEMEQLIDSKPERFSTNVSARPVLQSSIFPTVAYVAGPSEMEYYSQLGPEHKFHNVPMPVLIPRLKATFIPEKAAKLLGKLGINPWEPMPKIERGELEALGLPTNALHYLNNLLSPYEKPQERVYNWFEFQRQTDENLVKEFFEKCDWKNEGEYFCWLK